MFLRYLHTVRGMSQAECYDMWVALSNGTASMFQDDVETQKATFTLLWHQAWTTYVNVNCAKRLRSVQIFTSELGYLNALPAPRWVRQYWAALLFYYKFASQVNPRVPKSSTVINWCLRQTERRSVVYGGDNHCQDQIWRYSRVLPTRVIIDSPGTKDLPVTTYKPAFLAEGGQVCYEAGSLSEIAGLMSLIAQPSGICQQCGATFPVTPKTKRVLCPECYRQHRLAVKRECKRQAMSRQEKAHY